MVFNSLLAKKKTDLEDENPERSEIRQFSIYFKPPKNLDNKQFRKGSMYLVILSGC